MAIRHPDLSGDEHPMPSMTHAGPSTDPDPRTEEVVLGVDTHIDVHVAAVVTVQGVELATAEFATTNAGYQQLLAWAHRFGLLHRAGVEGTG
jgi:transposase